MEAGGKLVEYVRENGNEASLYGFQKGVSQNEFLKELIAASRSGLITLAPHDRGGKEVLNVKLTKRAVRRFNKVRRPIDLEANGAKVVEFMTTATGPVRINEIVVGTGLTREAVTEVLRFGRKEGRFVSHGSKSNFHARWGLS